MFTIGEFRFLVATTSDMLEAVHRLRYQVYVEEYKYEKPEDHPAGLEKDIYDPHSIHMAALDGSGQLVGTIRLVLNTELGLPALSLVKSHYEDKNPTSNKIVEVSRFALTRSLRGKTGDDLLQEVAFYLTKLSGPKPTTSSTEGLDKRTIVLLGLIHLMFTVMQQIQATDLYIMAERRLWLLLKHHRMKFRQVSPEIDYHGKRACFLARAPEVAEPMLSFRRMLTQGLARTQQPNFRLPALLKWENFELAGFRFQVATSPALLARVNSLGGMREPEGEGQSILLAALEQNGRAAGRVRLFLNTRGKSKKEGKISGFVLAPTYRRMIQSALENEDRPGLRECRKAVVVAMGLFRLLYKIGKQLRLTSLELEVGEPMARFLQSQGITLHALGADNYQLRLAEVEQRLLDFHGVKMSFRELLARRSGPSPLREFLGRMDQSALETA